MTKYYDVIVNKDLNKCEQLYKALLRVDCKGLDNSYLKQAATNRNPYCIYHAYRVGTDDKGIWFYHSYRDVDEVYNGISLTNFLKKIYLERTVTL